MTLSEIIDLALMQLGEDLADRRDFDDLFRRYANIGYQIVVRDYIKPRREENIGVDEDGLVELEPEWERIITAYDDDGHEHPVNAVDDKYHFKIHGVQPEHMDYRIIVELKPDDLLRDTDVPFMIPESFHSMLANYVCYRHLLNGNMAKQSRGNTYNSLFLQDCARLRPDGYQTITGWKNLYSASGVR